MKKLSALFLAALLMCSLLAACSGGEPAGDASTTGSGGTTQPAQTTQATTAGDQTLSGDVQIWMPDSFSASLNLSFLKDWEAAVKEMYPGINTTFEEYVEAGILEKLTVSMATGTTPDIFLDAHSRILPAATSGLLVDLTDVVSSIDSFAGNFAELGKIGNEHLYIPFQANNCYAMAINMDIAEEIGATQYLPADDVHWSYDDFLKCCELAKEAGYYGTQLFSGGPTGDAAMFSLYMTAGSKMFSDDLTSCTINNAGTKKALELLQTLIASDYVPAGAATTIDYNEAFYAGQSLFSLPQGSASIIMVRDKAFEEGELDSIFNIDFVMYPSPDGAAEPISASFGSTGFCIFKNDENADTINAAKAVLKMVYDDPSYMTELVTISGNTPVLTTAAPQVDDKYVPYVEKHRQFTSLYMTDSFGILEGWWSDWRGAYFPIMQKFYAGDASVDETLTELESTGNQIIGDYSAASSS